MDINKRDTIDDFMRLFRGRADAYGSEEGGCVRQPVTRELYERHLLGYEPIGIYPMVPRKSDWWCVWGCSDIDIEDYNMAVRLREALAAGGVTAYIERSRSKGYHVWVFAQEPVLAKDMRRMFLAAHQVADIPAREVNPKQETLDSSDKFGNYVRLPYANSLYQSSKRKILANHDTYVPMDVFVRDALLMRTPKDVIERLAGYYKPPTPSHTFNTDYVPCESLDDAKKNLSPLGKVIWRDGPLQGRDRSSTLAKLGHECVRSGLNPSETRIILVDADRRWGKYHMRTNGELEIDKLVSRVYITT
jgi:hypothetical protein